MRKFFPAFIALILVGCGGDGGTGPDGNQAPYFRDPPTALTPGSLLLNVVPGDQISVSAYGVDPDIEPVTYLWELVRQSGSDYVPETDPQAGTVLAAQTANASWVVGSSFTGSLRLRCTISDGKTSTSAVTRSFIMATPLNNLVVSSDLTLDKANSPYVATGGITVNAGVTLELEAGVELHVRPTRTGGGWERESIEVAGRLVTLGANGDPVLIRGGYSTDPEPGGGTEQLVGIVVPDGGRAELTYTRVQEAEAGLRVLSQEISTATNCIFANCQTGARVERGTGTTLTGVLFRENSTGLQLNSAAVTITDCNFFANASYGVNVDASSGPSTLTVTGSEFSQGAQTYVRLASLSGQPIEATIRGTNFIQQLNNPVMINLFSDCAVYTLNLRGNYWGSVLTPAEIVKLFLNDRSCGANVLDWTDSDCGGDPGACDWSNTAW